MVIKTPAWFDVNTYMANKLAQLQKTEPDANWTEESLAEAFVANGFSGEQGAYAHFLAYGMNEDVSPNALFNVDQYYVSKTAEFYDKSPSEVSALEIATVKDLIIKAYGSAWAHYDANGTTETDVNPSNDFDAAAYMEAKLVLMQAEDPHYTMADLQAAFAAAGYSPLEHFLLYGGQEGEVQQTSFPVPEGQRVPSITGETYNLTPDVDEVVGTSGSDVIIGATQDGEQTFTAGDSIDGGAGVDTLKLYGVNNVSKGLQTVKNVEQLEAFAGKGTYDVSGWEGLEKATFKAGDVTKVTGNAALTDVVLDGVGADFTAIGDGIANVTVKNMEEARGVTVTNTTKKHALNVTLENASKVDENDTPSTAVTVNDEAAETLNLTSKGIANSLTLGTATALKNLTISGEADLVADELDNADALESIDGSAAKGDLDLGTLHAATVNVATGEGDDEFTLGATKGKVTVATGAGDDEVTLGAALVKGSSIDLGAGEDTLNMTQAQLNKDAVVNGGDGTDTLVFTEDATFNNKATAEALNTVKDFEVLGVEGVKLTVDAKFVDFHNFLVSGDGSIDLSNAVDGDNVIFVGGKSTNDTITMATWNHTLNLHLVGTNTIANVIGTLTGVEKLTISSLGVKEEDQTSLADDNNVLALTSGSADLTVTGDQDLTLTLTASAANGFIVDATDFEAKLDVTGSAKADTITGSANADTLWGGAGKDTLTGGDGADRFVLATAVDMVGAAGANMNTITDFTVGEDKFLFDISGNFSGGTAHSGEGDILNGVTFSTTTAKMADMGTALTSNTSVADLAGVYSALGSLLGASTFATSAADGTATVARVVTFTSGDAAGTYLVINDATAGFLAASDVVIDITGIEGTLSAADFAFA